MTVSEGPTTISPDATEVCPTECTARADKVVVIVAVLGAGLSESPWLPSSRSLFTLTRSNNDRSCDDLYEQRYQEIRARQGCV
jgi:hypothetical protein